MCLCEPTSRLEQKLAAINIPSMAIAIFSTWTTYGTWIPGDERGWFMNGRFRKADDLRMFESALIMTDIAARFDAAQRRIVESTITDHCAVRGWILHAVNCRTNHVHVAVTAPATKIDVPRVQFKAWCSRWLNDHAPKTRKNWWTERGWDEYVDDVESLETVIAYVRDGQDDVG